MPTSFSTVSLVGVSSLIACLTLAGCEREPTPKMSQADGILSAPAPSATTTAQADTGTAMGTGRIVGQPSSSDGTAFDVLTRTEPTAAGAPRSQEAGPTDTPTTAGTLSRTERDFIEQNGAKSLFDIRVSELAAEKASDPALKSYAAMVAADQKGVSEEIKRLAAGHGVNVAQSLTPKDQKTLSALQNTSGTAFDKQYLQTVGITENEKAIAVYEKAGHDARNPAVKDYVQSTLPTLKAHLDAARKLQNKG